MIVNAGVIRNRRNLGVDITILPCPYLNFQPPGEEWFGTNLRKSPTGCHCFFSTWNRPLSSGNKYSPKENSSLFKKFKKYTCLFGIDTISYLVNQYSSFSFLSPTHWPAFS